MTLTAILLLLGAAVLHAGWNLLSKRQAPTAAFFLVANTAGGLLLTPVFVRNLELLPQFPPRTWWLLVATGFCLALYYAGLAGAYRAGDISVAYPLARSTPVLLVTGISVGLGLGGPVSVQCLLGIPLVVLGCFLVPMRSLVELRPSTYLNRVCALALVAAAGTAGYSLADDTALRLLRTTPSLAAAGTVELTLVYAYLEAVSSSLWLLLFILPRCQGRATLRQAWRHGKRHSVLAGIMIYATYCSVLVSLAFVRNVSYVVAFRQLSIPVGAMLGLVLLGEPAHRPKLLGVAIMLAGLVLVATG